MYGHCVYWIFIIWHRNYHSSPLWQRHKGKANIYLTNPKSTGEEITVKLLDKNSNEFCSGCLYDPKTLTYGVCRGEWCQSVFTSFRVKDFCSESFYWIQTKLKLKWTFLKSLPYFPGHGACRGANFPVSGARGHTSTGHCSVSSDINYNSHSHHLGGTSLFCKARCDKIKIPNCKTSSLSSL